MEEMQHTDQAPQFSEWLVTEVKDRPHIFDIEDYRRLIGDVAADRILSKAEPLQDLHVVNVNSTYYGGGVAELLSSMSLLMNTLGLKVGWRVIQGSPDFFGITKKMHNALQGGEINLSDLKKEIYEGVVYENAIRNHLTHDVVIVHDPQPLPMIEHYKKTVPWIWRCHIDLSNPHRELWMYLRRFIEKYDAVVVSREEYKHVLNTPQLVFEPAIDPFSIKNKQMSDEEIEERLDHYNIPTDLPLVVQVSRFDPWKDPKGVIDAFELASKEVDARLVLLGNVATDDPEGLDVYESIADRANDRVMLLSVEDTALARVARLMPPHGRHTYTRIYAVHHPPVVAHHTMGGCCW
ncbi:MAG: Trehalose synthase [Calditrichaeota bacterium]|nr:Trehalose synthase [Calditrichota bacterium]